MTYSIQYKRNAVLVIELYQDRYPYSELWHSEIKVFTIVWGISEYVFDQIKDRERLLEFQEDCDRMSWQLKFWLWEGHNNEELPLEESEKVHYGVVTTHIRKEIDDFCKKYNFDLDID